MILTLDLGNTNLYVGVYQEKRLLKEFRLFTDLNLSLDGYRRNIAQLLKEQNIDPNDFEGAILSSVVPSLTSELVSAVEAIINKKCLVVSKEIKSGLNIKIDNPNELGADLVCDAVGAINKYPLPIIIVDLGTANKYLFVDSKGSFEGCSIAPGIKVSFKALINNTAQLIDIAYKAPHKVVGKNSKDSLNSGVIFGSVAQITGLCQMIEKEYACKATVILTGGNAILVKDHLKGCIYDPTLILDGLCHIYYKNQGDKNESK